MRLNQAALLRCLARIAHQIGFLSSSLHEAPEQSTCSKQCCEAERPNTTESRIAHAKIQRACILAIHRCISQFSQRPHDIFWAQAKLNGGTEDAEHPDASKTALVFRGTVFEATPANAGLQGIIARFTSALKSVRGCSAAFAIPQNQGIWDPAWSTLFLLAICKNSEP